MQYYFGYGANRMKSRIREILATSPKGGVSGVLQKYRLAIQDLSTIPNPARGILETVWGKAFRAYTIIPGYGLVYGKIWELTDKQLEKMKEWEFDKKWRQIIKVSILRYDQQKISAYTDMAINHIGIKEIVEGLDYDEDLNINLRHSSIEDSQIEEIVKIRKQIQLMIQQS